MRSFAAAILLTTLRCFAQEHQEQAIATPAASAQSETAAPAKSMITVPAETKILMALKSPISTKSAHEGNGVYLETTFPVSIDNKMVIPAGTYVQGVIDKVVRPGRVKGRAQLQMHFTSLIFPSGYTVVIPGVLSAAPGLEHEDVNAKEGTVKEKGQKGKDAATIATGAAGGGILGAIITHDAKDAGLGGLAGGAVGLATVLLGRGDDIRMDIGSAVEMVLQRPLTLEEVQPVAAQVRYTPVQGIKPLEKPSPGIGSRSGVTVSPFPR